MKIAGVLLEDVVVEVARRHQVDESLLYRWRRLAAQGLLIAEPPAFVPVQITSEVPSPAAPPTEPPTPMPEAPVEPGRIEIELPRGGRVRITGAADPAIVAAALRALVGR